MEKPPAIQPQPVIDFWRAAGPSRWFAKDPDFDAAFRDKFAAAHAAAAAGTLNGWLTDDPAAASVVRADAALALLLLLDQYPRNAFRDTPRMFATDAAALAAAARTVDAGLDRMADKTLRPFFYMPFMHAEDLAAQHRCVALCTPLGGATLRYAQVHRDAIARFGRFPHRNVVLGRPSTPHEQAYLADGGFAG